MRSLSSESNESDVDIDEMCATIYDSTPIRVKDSHFHLPGTVRLVSIPPELANEPYARYDNGLRPELRDRKHFFHFHVESGLSIKITAILDTTEFCLINPSKSRWRADQTRYEKAFTRHSVMDIYHVYGLDIACSYLYGLCHSAISETEPWWLFVYLVGSLAIVDPEHARFLFDKQKKLGKRPTRSSALAYAALLSSLLALELETRSQAVIQPHTTALPVELLARIFDSVRISKVIARHVMYKRVTRLLSPREVEVFYTHEAVQSTGDDHFYTQHWDLRVIGSGFSLLYDAQRKKRPARTPVLSSYVDEAKARGIKTRTTLRHALDRVKTSNLNQLCAWVVLLSYHVGELPQTMLEIESHSDLVQHFETLSSVALFSCDEC